MIPEKKSIQLYRKNKTKQNKNIYIEKKEKKAHKIKKNENKTNKVKK